MSASLVGSEMCIRDRHSAGHGMENITLPADGALRVASRFQRYLLAESAEDFAYCRVGVSADFVQGKAREPITPVQPASVRRPARAPGVRNFRVSPSELRRRIEALPSTRF
eukprot:9319043-Alexandrium_andersonii.AAC.1